MKEPQVTRKGPRDLDAVVTSWNDRAGGTSGVTHTVPRDVHSCYGRVFRERLTLGKAKTMWILEDWDRLARISEDDLKDSPCRGSIALLVGSAQLQLGRLTEGARWVALAQAWGCSPRLITGVLVAGAHFSLGRAELASRDGQKSRTHVLAGIRSIASSEARDRRGRERRTRAGIKTISVKELAAKLGSRVQPPTSSDIPIREWQMARDDGPILRYLFEIHRPLRHLEFGTWQGWGARLCLETTDATVWTINLPDGEAKPDGTWAYAERIDDPGSAPAGAVSVTYGDKQSGAIVYHRTDAASYIGRLYREAGLGNRVCQIFCDSRNWDTSAYPADFFDSAFIDGGHQTDVIISDTRKALSVLRRGGMMIWHDFCPIEEVRTSNPVVGEVTAILEAMLPEIAFAFSTLAWISPSMILVGFKK